MAVLAAVKEVNRQERAAAAKIAMAEEAALAESAPGSPTAELRSRREVQLEALGEQARLLLTGGKPGAGGARICILGGAELGGNDTRELVKTLAQRLTVSLCDVAAFITAGSPGVERLFAEQSTRRARVWNLVPTGRSSGFRGGTDLHVGADAEQQRDIFTRLGDVYVVIGGGSALAHDASRALANGATLVPIGRAGGAAAGRFGFPAQALLQPTCATEEEWALITSEDADLERSVAAAVEVIGRLAEAVAHGGDGQAVVLRVPSSQASEASPSSAAARALARHSNAPEMTPAQLGTALERLRALACQQLEALEELRATHDAQATMARGLAKTLQGSMEGVLRALERNTTCTPERPRHLMLAASQVLEELCCLVEGKPRPFLDGQRRGRRAGRWPAGGGEEEEEEEEASTSELQSAISADKVEDMEKLLSIMMALVTSDSEAAMEAAEVVLATRATGVPIADAASRIAVVSPDFAPTPSAPASPSSTRGAAPTPALSFHLGDLAPAALAPSAPPAPPLAAPAPAAAPAVVPESDEVQRGGDAPPPVLELPRAPKTPETEKPKAPEPQQVSLDDLRDRAEIPAVAAPPSPQPPVPKESGRPCEPAMAVTAVTTSTSEVDTRSCTNPADTPSPRSTEHPDVDVGSYAKAGTPSSFRMPEPPWWTQARTTHENKVRECGVEPYCSKTPLSFLAPPLQPRPQGAPWSDTCLPVVRHSAPERDPRGPPGRPGEEPKPGTIEAVLQERQWRKLQKERARPQDYYEEACAREAFSRMTHARDSPEVGDTWGGDGMEPQSSLVRLRSAPLKTSRPPSAARITLESVIEERRATQSPCSARYLEGQGQAHGHALPSLANRPPIPAVAVSMGPVHSARLRAVHHGGESAAGLTATWCMPGPVHARHGLVPPLELHTRSSVPDPSPRRRSSMPFSFGGWTENAFSGAAAGDASGMEQVPSRRRSAH